MILDLAEREVRRYKPCSNKDCKEFQVLDNKVYKFKNTGNPYMLRVCPKCNGASLILVKEV